MATSIDLKLNRDIVYPDFEGYKLSLDKLPIYKADLENGVYNVGLADDQFSYHHAKLFGVHNHLTVDPWNTNSVYFVNKQWNVKRATAHDTSIDCSAAVYTISDASNQQLVPARHDVQLQFLSPDLAVIGDGAGQIQIIETGERVDSNTKSWKLLYSKTVPEDKLPCLLLDAVQLSCDENHKVECLLVHVNESTPEEKDKYKSQYLTVLEWVTFSSADRKSWTLDRSRQLVSKRPFSYATLCREGGSIIVAGEAEFIFTRDSEIPVVSDEEKEEENTDTCPPDYTWVQTKEDVTVQFTVPEGITKADVYLSLSPDRVDFGLKNNREMLKGDLHDSVDVECSTWTIDRQRVDLLLSKRTESMWPLVVKGDTRGEMLIDPAEAAIIHERLAHLTSEEWNPYPESAEKPFNSQQLEDCDMFPDDNFLLMRVDGNTHRITHTTNLGANQWLFNCSMEHNNSAALCLRHDVDGLLWKPELSPQSSQAAWTHFATFNALGYVQASKMQRKFTASPPDCSYAAMCDINNHVYLYRQSSPVATPLRNRKTGKQVNAVAKQQVISLDTLDCIMGLQATNDRLFVITESKLHMIKV